MSDRYRPSGPKSSRFNEEYDRSRGPGRGSDRDRDRDHDHDRAFDERDFNDRKSQSESSRDYYAPPVRGQNGGSSSGSSNGSGSKRYDDRDDHRERNSRGPPPRGGGQARDSYRLTNGPRGERDGYRQLPNGPRGERDSYRQHNGPRPERDSYIKPERKTPAGPSGPSGPPGSSIPMGPSGSHKPLPTGPKGAGAGPHSIPTGPKIRPSGPSGYRKEENVRDTYRPTAPGPPVKSGSGTSTRKALPPQESTRPIKTYDNRAYDQTYDNRSDNNYKKRKQSDYYDDAYNDTYPPKKGYRYNNNLSSYPSHPHGGYGSALGPPKKPKKVRRFLNNSQIYLIRMFKPNEIYARVQQVGEGTYGKVYKARNSVTNEFVALKKLRLESEREGFPITAMREIKLLQSFQHPNVVGLLEMMVETNQIFMIFDYMDHDLTGLLTHPDMKLEECHKKFIFKQLMEGLNYLHKKRVIHRDIKGSNILLDNCGVVKIADFGLARTMKTIQNGELPDYTNRVITIWYRPPELLLGATDYGREVDIWGVGCLLVELYTRLAAFQGQDEVSQLQKIFNLMGTPTLEAWPTMDELPWFEMLKPKVNKASNFAKEFKPILSELSFDLAEKLLQLDPKKRLSAEEALEHPYFTTDPQPEPLYFLKDLKGEWHEFETKKRRRMERKRLQEIKSEQSTQRSV